MPLSTNQSPKSNHKKLSWTYTDRITQKNDNKFLKNKKKLRVLKKCR